MAQEPLSQAGLHFGEAFCVPESQKGAPLSSMTPQEQDCVRRVGIGWERDIVAKLGGIGTEQPFGAPLNDPPQRYSVRTAGGHELGTLTLDSGDVTLCLRQDSHSTCARIGHGHDALQTARKMLTLVGMHTEG